MQINLAIESADILIVEDDDGIRLLLTRILRDNGYQVKACRGGADMWNVWGKAHIDLVLLDLMLPGTPGLDLLKAIRATSSVPVIIISARSEESDRVVGLELGADDYIAKPFGRPELLARVRALLRRAILAPSSALARAETLIFSQWRLDLRSRTLLDPEGAAVDLSGAEFDLLLVLLENPGRVMSREQLLEMSRARLGSASDRSVDTLVSRLRRKLEPPEGMPAVIKTVRGAGYMLASKVEQA